MYQGNLSIFFITLYTLFTYFKSRFSSSAVWNRWRRSTSSPLKLNRNDDFKCRLCSENILTIFFSLDSLQLQSNCFAIGVQLLSLFFKNLLFLVKIQQKCWISSFWLFWKIIVFYTYSRFSLACCVSECSYLQNSEPSLQRKKTP